MINPALLEQLSTQRQREILKSIGVRRLGSSRAKVRERLGWSLVGLGARLALSSQGREAVYWHRALS
ncbi:MAG: hypothetical protein ACLP36_14590 [Acidimicrobiales bacterium]|jgi:hypothetical protein